MKKAIVFVLAVLLLSCNQGTVKQENRLSAAKAPAKNPGKAFVSFRIGVPVWISETRCNELFGLFDRHKGVTDEITFFTSETHPPIPLQEFKRRTGILKGRMEEARKRGYRTGINILSSIGHHNENLDNSLQGNYTFMTNIDGAVCNGSYCPNDENMKKYIGEIYQSAARANPDYIWIDDDIRFGHMPIGQGCFCDICLGIFEKESGRKYTRETLKKAFNEGTAESKLPVRKEWLQHNRNTIGRLFTQLEETVHGINPAIVLGFMTGDRFFEGYDFDNWAKILAGPNHTPVMWRPGGGFYEDSNTRELVGKSHDVGRQVAMLPAEVVSIQSEIENFPYQRLKKAANSVVLEACSHIAAGCTGAAFNVLSMYDEPLDEYEPLVSRLQESRPFFDLLAGTLGRSPISGVQTFWNKDSYITGNLDSGNWTSYGNPVVSHEFYDIGLPISYSNEHALVTVLGKDNVFALSREQITALLSKGVYLDVPALQQLNAMGFGELTGFEMVNSVSKDRIEKFTGHSLNGSFAGRKRDNRQSFWNSPGYTLRKTNDKAEALSYLVDYTGTEVSPLTTGVFENKLGGRICVAGYYPWTFMGNLSKSSQMKSVFRWLSKDSLPGYISSFHKMNLWIREPENGRIALALSNSSLDPATDVVLMLKTEKRTIRVYDMQCHESIVNASGEDGPYRRFVVGKVDPWQMRLVVCE